MQDYKYESVSSNERITDAISRGNKNKCQMICNIITSLSVFVILGLLIYLVKCQINLNYKIDRAIVRISKTEINIAHIISNSSNNAGVLTEINKLRTEVYTTQNTINQQITSTKADITGELSDTKIELEEAMLNAKQKIKFEVDNVKEALDSYVVNTNERLTAESDFIKYQIAGTFTLLACMISLWHVINHLRHQGKPSVQRRILAILWMVPIYSVTSWLSLVFPRAEHFLSAFRDCYEAYVVYTFIAFLIAILSDDYQNNEVAAVTVLAKYINIPESSQHMSNATSGHSNQLTRPPLPCFHYNSRNRRSIAATILFQCQSMAMQFVGLKLLLTAVPFILMLCHISYFNSPIFSNKNGINWSSPRVYVLLLLNISVAIAFYGLLCFYHATEKALAWCDPWPKFLCIKGVVFMTFWQSFAISTLSGAGFVDAQSAHAAENLIICIEMFLASLLHVFIFPYEEWQEGYKKEKEQSLMFRDTMALKDFINDIKGMIFKRAFDGISHQTNDPDIFPDNDNNNSNNSDVLNNQHADDVGSTKTTTSLHSLNKLKNDIELAVSELQSSPAR